MDLLSFLGALVKGVGCILGNPLPWPMSVSESDLVRVGRHITAQELFREDLLEKIRGEHPQRLLVCCLCGWSWLTVETAGVLRLPGIFLVVCRDPHDCYRRECAGMKVRREVLVTGIAKKAE